MASGTALHEHAPAVISVSQTAEEGDAVAVVADGAFKTATKSFCSASTAPTRRTAARSGKMPSTSLRRRMSRLRRTKGLLDRDPAPDLFGEGGEGEDVGACLVEELGRAGEALGKLGHAARLLLAHLGGVHPQRTSVATGARAGLGTRIRKLRMTCARYLCELALGRVAATASTRPW